MEVQIEFPRTDLDTVVGCLTGGFREEVSFTLAMEEQPREVDLVAVLQSLIKDIVVIADEEAYAVLQLDELSEEAARVLVGPELFDTPSPGFYPGLRTLRPRLTTWLALRATVAALDLWDVEEDEGDLEMHLDGARLAYRWCARSYRQLTGDELDDRQDIEDWTAMSRSGHPRQPRPSYHGRGVGRLLDIETSSPRELDENPSSICSCVAPWRPWTTRTNCFSWPRLGSTRGATRGAKTIMTRTIEISGRSRLGQTYLTPRAMTGSR